MPDLSHTIAYRAVEGAIRNALHGHPKWRVPEAFSQSVAKRAAGTLMAHAGPSLLASARKSGQRQRPTSLAAFASGGVPRNSGRLLSATHRHLTILVTIAHKAEDHGRFIELVTAARIIKREIQRGAAS